MGCLNSGPLQKTHAKVSVPPKITEVGEHSYDSNSGIRSYASFSSYLMSTENPHIFEWCFKKEIGRGATSRVFLTQHSETGEYFASKVYDKEFLYKHTIGGEEKPFYNVKRELEILAMLNHPHVLQLIEAIEDDYSNSVIIITPYAKLGTLQTYLVDHELTEKQLSVCFYQIAEALFYIHEQNIVHRDVKPDNILVMSEDTFCLSDFSVSILLSNSEQKLIDTKGSPAFLSPEECEGDPFFPKPSDVWAYGISIYFALFKKLPFNLDVAQGKTVANTIFSVTELLSKCSLEFPNNTVVSDEVKDLIIKTLNVDPTKRPPFEQIIRHPWFSSFSHREQKRIADEIAMASGKEFYNFEENSPRASTRIISTKSSSRRASTNFRNNIQAENIS